MREFNGKTAKVIFSLKAAGKVKHKVFPEPVGNTPSVCMPLKSDSITSRWYGLNLGILKMVLRVSVSLSPVSSSSGTLSSLVLNVMPS